MKGRIHWIRLGIEEALRTALFGACATMVALLLCVQYSGRAQDGRQDAPMIRGIQDNSFLLEEAYNQDEGVVQNIQEFTHYRGRNWVYSFTQEWPVAGQFHQLSYSIPVLSVDEPEKGPDVGDIMLNYRYQLVLKDKFAMAPRLSLSVPTGKAARRTGSGTVGIQACIPVSLELGNRWATHWNAAVTYLPHSEGTTGDRANALGYYLGGSMVFAVTNNAQLLVESIWSSSESVVSAGKTERSNSFYVSPGARFAINCKSGLQIVPGIAVPIGVGPSSGDVGVLGYLSLEFPFTKAARENAK
jgi:hypothetical protein